MSDRNVRIEQRLFGACEGCGLHATLRSIDVRVPARAGRRARGKLPAQAPVPAGWAALIALCGFCWDEMVCDLNAKRRLGLWDDGAPALIGARNVWDGF